jgi:predicted NAD/FAD-dependent oxidoreductase
MLGTAAVHEVETALDERVGATLQTIGSEYGTAGEKSERDAPDPQALARQIAAELSALLGGSGQKRSALNELFAEPAKRLVFGQANFVGSERYTLALPGSIRHRISPLDRSVANMTIAGDWTACGLDAGCVEAAVMSGMLAAHAITGGEPELDEIVGYHHP